MRQKLVFPLMLSMQAATQVHAATEPLDNIGEPFYSKRIQINWNLRTNPLPDTIRLFEVLPASVSASTVSNLLSVTGLSTIDIKPRAARPLAPMLFHKGDSSLTIDPENGHMMYYTIDRNTLWPTNVPERVRAFHLATNLACRMDIQLSEFIPGTNSEPKPWFYPGTMGRFDKQTRQLIQAPCSIGIEFRRQLDRISCYSERIYLQFESQEKLTQLEACWHKLEPSGSFPVATTNQIANWIKEGRARVQSLEVAGPGGRRIHPSEILGISIGEIALYYAGATYHKHTQLEEKSAKYLYPFAVLTAEAEIGPEDKETIVLFVPVTANALTSISRTRDKYGFAIYPSRRFGPPDSVKN